MNYLMESLKYVAGDYYFIPSMAMIVICGLFVGSVIFNGDVQQIKKGIVVLLSYASLLVMVNYARIYPLFSTFSPEHSRQPLAGIVTILFVTIFYLLGMCWGVYVTKKAHAKII